MSQSLLRSALRLSFPFFALFAVACAAPTDDAEDPSLDEAQEPGEATQASSVSDLFVSYDVNSACTIYINAPGSGVSNNHSWKMTGKRITWRYNIDDTYALVSDPERAGKTYPWWGFTRRDCIEGEPTRVREGRSQVAASGWRPVEVSLPPATITKHTREVKSNATLRDPANFVTGNVPKGWHVDVTGKTRSNGFWVEVYVPNANRWGYIEASQVD